MSSTATPFQSTMTKCTVCGAPPANGFCLVCESCHEKAGWDNGLNFHDNFVKFGRAEDLINRKEKGIAP